MNHHARIEELLPSMLSMRAFDEETFKFLSRALTWHVSHALSSCSLHPLPPQHDCALEWVTTTKFGRHFRDKIWGHQIWQPHHFLLDLGWFPKTRAYTSSTWSSILAWDSQLLVEHFFWNLAQEKWLLLNINQRWFSRETCQVRSGPSYYPSPHYSKSKTTMSVFP